MWLTHQHLEETAEQHYSRMPPPDFWQEEGAERPAQEVGNQSPAHDLLGLIKSRVLRLQGRLQGTAALCANIADVIWQEQTAGDRTGCRATRDAGDDEEVQ